MHILICMAGSWLANSWLMYDCTFTTCPVAMQQSQQILAT